jgi:hypothetical protein
MGARMPLSFFHPLSLIHLNSIEVLVVAVVALLLVYLLLGWRVKTLKITLTGVTVTFK